MRGNDKTDWRPIECELCGRSQIPGVTPPIAFYQLDPQTITITNDDSQRLERTLLNLDVFILCEDCLHDRLGGRLHEPTGDFVTSEDTVQKLVDAIAKDTGT